jgi:hypothetical protein
VAWATLSIPPFSRKFARLGHRFDELSKRDRFLRTGTKFLISIPASPLGTFATQKGMSALPPKADMCGATRYVRFVPKADIRRVMDALN